MGPQKITDAPPKALARPQAVDLAADPVETRLNSAFILDAARRFFEHFGRWPNPESVVVAVLWVASTHFRTSTGGLLFRTHPRLFHIAPMNSGKTRLMKLEKALSHNPTGIVKAPVSSYGLRDAFSERKTVFLDEVDRQIGGGQRHLDTQSIISAYEEDTASLNSGRGSEQKEIFGPMTLAAKAGILTGTGPFVKDLFQRSFILTPEHSDDVIPRLDSEFEEAAKLLRQGLAMFGASARPENPEDRLWPVHGVPRRLAARDLDLAGPLLAVADRAVDPETVDMYGTDIRWAQLGRAAVQKILLDHGSNGEEIRANLLKMFTSMGIEI